MTNKNSENKLDLTDDEIAIIEKAIDEKNGFDLKFSIRLFNKMNRIIENKKEINIDV